MAERKMQLEDWLDDLCVRFIINLPQEDLSSVARICFQVEEAQWFYEDFVRPLDPTLPSMSLRSFCLRIFQHCPLLAPFSAENHMKAFDEFMQYKTRVPVRGAILLNEAMDSTVLVKGWKKGANWSFPRGKINKDEDDLDCAIREVNEETGFNIRDAGLVPTGDDVKYIEITMREQQIRLYVFRNIPMDTNFQPRTRKEISKIQWYRLSELPAFRKKGSHQPDDAAAASNANKFYMVAPFLVPLKKWVVQQKKKDAARAVNHSHLSAHYSRDDPLTEDDLGAQPESGAPTSIATPAIDTMEGATLELQRLLKVQPPTQGIQLGSTEPEAPSRDQGDALLAILQSKKPEAPAPVQPMPGSTSSSQIPHTPLDLMYTTAPQPHTPHHHHPVQLLSTNQYQPPPNFPMPPQNTQNYAAAYYNQMRSSMQAAPQYQGYAQNMSYAMLQQRPPKEPVLLHPQPLPPQVQQSLLTRGILPTPNLPETMGLASASGSQPAYNVQPGTVRGPVFPQTMNFPMPPPQMTTHTISLLNVFKGDAKQVLNNKPVPVATVQVPTAPAPANVNQYSQYHQAPAWPNLQHSKEQAPSGTTGLPKAVPEVQSSLSTVLSSVSTPAAAALSSQPVPTSTDKHRSTLLDMFKKQGPLSPTSSDSTVRPTKAEIDATRRPSGPLERASKPQSSADAIAAATQTNGQPVVMNPELNLPYRALEILSRPKQAENQPIQQRQGLGGASAAAAKVSKSIHASMDQSTVPHPNTLIQSITQPGPITQGGSLRQQPFVANNHPQYQPELATSQKSTLSGRHENSDPEQKQKLLSLFGQPRPAPVPGAAKAADQLGTGKSKDTVLEQIRTNAPPRSARVTSLAGGGGDGEPPVSPGGADLAGKQRQGNQPPISPADRQFLLGFLQSVTDNTR